MIDMPAPSERFPRTMVGGVSLSRMIIGTNWFLGWSHCTKAKDAIITDTIDDHKKIADILEVFFNAGVNTVMGQIQHEKLHLAVRETEQRTGVPAIVVSTPSLPTNLRTAVDGFNMDEVRKVLDKERELGAKFCLTHACTTDLMVDKCAREVRQMAPVCAAIRERGMIPGLSTHLPETIIFSDETDLDVETYISIYNAMGFLMPLEIDWVMQTIHNARKPVMTIKPMAAGQLRPLQALTFVWNTLRSQDMMTVGTMSPREAHEVVEMSLSILEHRMVNLELQETRSKSTVKPSIHGK